MKYFLLLLSFCFSQVILPENRSIQHITATSNGTYLAMEDQTLRHLESGKQWDIPKTFREVYDVAHDTKGNLFFATAKGVLLFNTIKERFSSISPKQLQCSQNKIHSIQVHSPNIFATCGKRLVRYHQNMQDKTFWKLPIKTKFFRVIGPYLLISAKGLHVLDTRDSQWSHFDQLDGLPSNTIISMDTYQNKILISTSQGLAWWDPASSTIIPETRSSLWGAALHGNTLVGYNDNTLKRYDLNTKVWSEKQNNDILVISSYTSSATGFLYAIEGKGLYNWAQSPVPWRISTQNGQIDIHYPTEASIKTISTEIAYLDIGQSFQKMTSMKKNKSQWSALIPENYQGELVLNIKTTTTSGLISRYSYPFYFDQIPPHIKLNPYPQTTSKNRIKLKGQLKDLDLNQLLLLPSNKKISIDSKGLFQIPISLQTGLNSLQILAIDINGNQSQIPINITLDDTPPVLNLELIPDTIPVPYFSAKIQLNEIPKKVLILPQKKVRTKIKSNTIHIQADNLQPGNNRFSIALEDSSQNKIRTVFSVFYDSPKHQTTISHLSKPIQLLYKVKKGETLSKIALRFYGVAKMYPVLIKYNHLRHNKVQAGDTIKIPLYNDITIGLAKSVQQSLP